MKQNTKNKLKNFVGKEIKLNFVATVPPIPMLACVPEWDF